MSVRGNTRVTSDNPEDTYDVLKKYGSELVELARKQKTKEGLTPEEKTEQAALREEYIQEFRNSMRGILDNTYIQYADGTKKKVEPKK